MTAKKKKGAFNQESIPSYDSNITNMVEEITEAFQLDNKKKLRGRPKLDTNPHDKKMTLRIPDYLHDWLRDASHHARMPLNKVAVDALLEAFKDYDGYRKTGWRGRK